MNSPAVEALFSMYGKICLVTGGSRGLGYQMARGFLEAGAAIMLAGKAGAFMTGDIVRVDDGSTLVS